MWWQIGAAANFVVAAAYAGIALALLVPLLRTHQVPSNCLGTATVGIDEHHGLDMRERRRRALEINDNIVQGLAVAKLALELDERERSAEAMEVALASARTIISNLLGDAHDDSRLGPGDLRRRLPARLGEP